MTIRGSGRGDVDEEVAADLGALLPHQLLGVGLALGVELGVAERALRRAVGAHEQLLAEVLAAHDGDERGAPVLAGDLCERPRGRSRLESAPPRRRSRRRTAARRPRPPRRRCRTSAAAARRRLRTLSATSMTAPSTQPPETMPETSPRSLIAIFAPGGRGAERRVAVMVAIATCAPSRDPAIDVLDYILHRRRSFPQKTRAPDTTPGYPGDSLARGSASWRACGAARERPGRRARAPRPSEAALRPWRCSPRTT